MDGGCEDARPLARLNEGKGEASFPLKADFRKSKFADYMSAVENCTRFGYS